MGWKDRTELLLGPDGLKKLEEARVVVVGVGGVGAAACEMLVRAGIGNLTIIDNDSVSLTNINRQLPALRSTVGRSKVQVLSERLLDINPQLKLRCIEQYVCQENVGSVVGLGADYVIDAIDTLSPKIALIQHCTSNSLNLVSAMGAGAKTDITKVEIDDISRTKYCPLAHQLRKRLHRLGIKSGFLAVYSTEIPDHDAVTLEESRNKKSQVGTISYMPTVFGCACAQAVICRIAGLK